MLLSEFNYDLPPELIAQEPLADRSASRMLVVNRASGTWEDRRFTDFPGYVRPGDCLVLNDSRVFPSRLIGRRERGEGGKVEVFLVRPVAGEELEWTALVHPGRKMRTGERVIISDELSLVILARGEHGERTVKLEPKGDLYDVLDRAGHTPLPPYIRRSDTPQDRERYQTVYAQQRGSVAAPTAGLHFTPEILKECQAAGAEIARVTLHVGLGTFQPLHTGVIEEVKLHEEAFHVGAEAIAAMDRSTERGARVIAAGTTSVRAIESDPTRSETDLFIAPGFSFRRAGALLTNFHLPKSSLLVLVCAFAGTELALAAYRHAVEQRYRFFSYGDCMFIV